MCTQGLVAGSHATVRQTQIQDFDIYSSTHIYDSFDTDMDLPSEMKRALSRAEIELLQFHLQHLQQAMKSSKLELPQSKKENQSQKDVCKTAGCKDAASMLMKSLDQTINPCKDFYQFACGGFEKHVVIPEDRTSWTQFARIDKKLQEQLKHLLKVPPVENESKVLKKVKAVYAACMDEAMIEQIGLQPLVSKLDTMGGWPLLQGSTWNESGFSWIETTYKFNNHSFSSDLLFAFAITTDSKNSSWSMMVVDQASLGLAQAYLVRGLKEKVVAAYYKYMVNTAVLLGADRSSAETEMMEVLEFEMELAHASMPREMRRDSERLYNRMMIKDLSEYAPMVPWLDYINNLLSPYMVVKDTERLILTEPGYLRNLTAILKKAKKRTIANYMFFRAASSSISYFTEAAKKVKEEYSKEVSGTKIKVPRWRACVGQVNSIFSGVVGHMYIKKHFNEDAKKTMRTMVKDIKEEMKKIISNVNWMDDITRKGAIQKVEKMQEYIGYPEELLNVGLLEELYKDLEVFPDQHYQNAVEIGKWSTSYVVSRMRERIDKTDWKRHDQPAIVNAFYSYIENSIQFPAGILQGNFFDLDRPAYMNYGGIGWVIGHEITHGFDDQGRQFDADGNLAQWWEQSAEENYLDKAQCVIWQYGNYTAKPININLNGINTQGENIADIGGLKGAYNAYRRWIQKNGEEPKIPGFTKYTSSQMFWIAAGQTWCGKYRTQALENSVKSGSHSPGPFRVKGVFSNSPDFSEDFNCPQGSPMNPRDKCKVW